MSREVSVTLDQVVEQLMASHSCSHVFQEGHRYDAHRICVARPRGQAQDGISGFVIQVSKVVFAAPFGSIPSLGSVFKGTVGMAQA